MREIVFDTETTGLRPEEGERIIEIGAVELENRFLTGRTFHAFINPQGRAIHPDALKVHGIEDRFLADKPVFAAIADEFLAFVSDANLVAHNAFFDMGFVNAELARLGVSPIDPARVIDTLAIARRKHPMGPNSLDALCQRYGIDNSRRTRHGALLDSELLAEIYIELQGGRQSSMLASMAPEAAPANLGTVRAGLPQQLRERPDSLGSRLSEAGKKTHEDFIETLGEKALWKRYF